MSSKQDDDDSPLHVTLERIEDIWDCTKDNSEVMVTLDVHVLYSEGAMSSTRLWTNFLVDRHVQAGTTLLLHHPENKDHDEISLLNIDTVHIARNSSSVATTTHKVVRLPSHPKFLHIHVTQEPDETDPSKDGFHINNEDNDRLDSIVHVELAQRLRHYLFIQGPARPHGILLQGVAGVGKTHLVRRILKSTNKVRWISAATATDMGSLKSLQKTLESPSRKKKLNAQCDQQSVVVVLDDVHLLLDHDDEDSDNLQSWKEFATLQQFLNFCKSRNDVTVLALGRPTKPSTSSRRLFEIVWTMETPTARQREILWQQLLLPDLPTSYATALASVTAGCVASDLVHM
jgi:hypothetical protein